MSNVLTVFAAFTAGLTLVNPAVSLSAQRAIDCPNVDQLTAGMDPALAHVRYLADDALEGRGAGTNGARCAAQYIAAVTTSADRVSMTVRCSKIPV